MNSAGVLRVLIAAACLGVGVVSANGTEPGPDGPAVAPVAPVAPVAMPAVTPSPTPPAVQMTPVWMQVPLNGAPPYYLAPQAAMPWAMAPAYPVLPPAQMFVPPPGWVPFVLVLVPMQAPTQGGVNYGPVAETPVVVLPPEVPASAAEAGPAAVQAPVSASAPPAVPSAAVPPVAAPAGPEVDAVVPASVPEAFAAPGIDYGPVAPTPVIELPAPDQAAVAEAKPAAKPVPRPVRKPVARKPVAKPRAAVPPVKKRMCWSNGVVAPCR